MPDGDIFASKKFSAKTELRGECLGSAVGKAKNADADPDPDAEMPKAPGQDIAK